MWNFGKKISKKTKTNKRASEDKKKKWPYTEEEEKKIKQRLKDLGYL